MQPRVYPSIGPNRPRLQTRARVSDTVAEQSDREEAMNPRKSEQHLATHNSIKRDEAAKARQRARERAAEETLPRKGGPARGAPRAS